MSRFRLKKVVGVHEMKFVRMHPVCSGFLRIWFDARRNQQCYTAKKAECLEPETNLRIKVTTKTMQQIRKCHEFQFENVETLDFGFLCLFRISVTGALFRVEHDHGIYSFGIRRVGRTSHSR